MKEFNKPTSTLKNARMIVYILNIIQIIFMDGLSVNIFLGAIVLQLGFIIVTCLDIYAYPEKNGKTISYFFMQIGSVFIAINIIAIMVKSGFLL